MKVTTTKIAGHKALRYSLATHDGMPFYFHHLHSVSEQYQKQAKRIAEKLADDHGCVVRYGVEIDEAPWVVDVIEKDYK